MTQEDNMNKEFLKVKEAYRALERKREKNNKGNSLQKKIRRIYLFTKSKDKPYNTRNQYSGMGISG